MPQQHSATYKICIIGAGFGGIAMAIRLLQHGIQDFILLEKANEIGGTWRDNQYPGAACDVQSHMYSLSFAPKADWSQRYADAAEILAYLKQLVADYHLSNHCQFASEVIASEYCAKTCQWQLQLNTGQQILCQYFILATGPLHLPRIPTIKGIEHFQGKVFHSAQWDHDYNFHNKNVASIGTGGSAIQYIPKLAPLVKQLYVLQRSAAWVLARDDRPYLPLEKKLFQRHDWLRKCYRSSLYWRNESRFISIKQPSTMHYLAKLSLKMLNNQVKDPALIAKLSPDYQMGCKRILVSNQYYPSFNRPNVELVTESIREIKARSIITTDGREREIDCLIYGTGFITDPREYLKTLNCRGINGVNLSEHWQNAVESYYGICTKGFPNLFQLLGPNTILAHNSVIFMIEAQVNYILKLMHIVAEKQCDAIVVKDTVQDQFNTTLQQKLQNRVWQSGCMSWYQDQTAKNFALWPDYTWQYWLKTQKVKLEDYQLLHKNS